MGLSTKSSSKKIWPPAAVTASGRNVIGLRTNPMPVLGSTGNLISSVMCTNPGLRSNPFCLQQKDTSNGPPEEDPAAWVQVDILQVVPPLAYWQASIPQDG